MIDLMNDKVLKAILETMPAEITVIDATTRSSLEQGRG